MISFAIVSSNRLPSNVFNIKTDLMHWFSGAGQVPMTLFHVTGPTVNFFSCDTASACEASQYL